MLCIFAVAAAKGARIASESSDQSHTNEYMISSMGLASAHA
jgi:hypothetical protein